MLHYHLHDIVTLAEEVLALKMQAHLQGGQGFEVELALRALLQHCFEVDSGVVAQLGPERLPKSQGALKHHVQSTCTLVLEWEGWA